jgi:hypothetical protein
MPLKIGKLKISEKLIAAYGIWILINLSILLIFSDGPFNGDYMGSDHFWPFNSKYYSHGIGDYDITEFLFYSIFPAAIYIIYRYIKIDNSKTV